MQGSPATFVTGQVTARPAGAHDSPGRQVRGSVVSELYETASRPFTLRGACIEGDVDLSGCRNLQALRLTDCLLLGSLRLNHSELVALDLTGTEIRVGGEAADAIAVDGRYGVFSAELVLGPGFLADAPVKLQGAKVGGEIDCRRTELTGRGEWSLDLAGATLGQDLYLTRCTTRGGVNLSGAEIRGQVDGERATFCAALPGDPDNHRKRHALWGQRVRIKESLLLSGATVEGSVDLLGANIDGQVRLDGTTLSVVTEGTSDRDVLRLKGATVGALRFLDVTVNAGKINLDSCSVKTLIDDRPSWQLPTRRGERAGVMYSIAGLNYKGLEDDGWTPYWRRRWVSSAEDASRPGPYTVLADAYKANGARGEERKCRILGASRSASPWERVALGWLRYGFRPGLALVPLLLLAVVTYAQVHHVALRPDGLVQTTKSTPVQTIDNCDSAVAKCLNEVMYAIDAVLPIDFDENAKWRPNEELERGRYLSQLLRLDFVATWIFAGLFLGAVSGVIRRD